MDPKEIVERRPMTLNEQCAAFGCDLVDLLRREGHHSGVWFADRLLQAADELESQATLILTLQERIEELEEGLEWIDQEAPSTEPHDAPTVGFPPSRDPEVDDGNDLIREAYDEGVARGLWLAAEKARKALPPQLAGSICDRLRPEPDPDITIGPRSTRRLRSRKARSRSRGDRT